ncbi:uncharacterized protein BDV17DRAFT_270017 [Aspergillus undulatus]|uniref:uncharacterized protein n=1 Tax=Aspergillus undulatus TaxID=1810928 RepID=UPI003CCD8A59
MLSVWNHAPNRFMVAFLRAAQFSRRSFRKGCSYSTSFQPIYVQSLDLPANAFVRPNFSQPGIVMPGPADTSSCEFWCSSRLILSRLNQQSSPSEGVLEPWAPLSGCGGEVLDVDSIPSRSSTPAKTGCENLRSDGSSDDLEGSLRYSKPSPSDYLIDTLQKIAIRLSQNHTSNWTLSGKSQKPLITPLASRQRQIFMEKAQKQSLRMITDKYLRTVDPVLRTWTRTRVTKKNPHAAQHLDNALRKMLLGKHIEHLESRNYDITDVMAWVWVLKSHTVYEATLRIYLLEADTTANRTGLHQSIPIFIPLMLLRQELDLKTFRLLLVYSLHIITGQPLPRLDDSLRTVSGDSPLNHLNFEDTVSTMPLINPKTCATFVARLLFHARLLWPEAQLPIAQAFAIYLRISGTPGSSFVAKTLNNFIRLLSLPSGPRPYLTASIRQQAQFELLKAMANTTPALPVTRRGYQGLATVQLAHKKTAAEREYAELQAPSWPPWKEERSGIDSNKGVEGRKSRAMRVMSQMREAGYRQSLWEEVTGILAGWDTDNSPTIQTRALARQPEHLNGRPGRERHYAIWEARIRSTRTVREAWACFMEYERRGLPPRYSIFVAMGEKLIYEPKLFKKERDLPLFALPGDGPEVFPDPASLRDWIWTSVRPPALHEFLEKMLSQGFRPSGRFLASLLNHAPNFRTGMDCLCCSDLTNQQLKVLFSFGEVIPDHDAKSQQALDELPEYLISAFVRFLCKFSVVAYQSGIPNIVSADAFPIITNTWVEPHPQVPTLFTYINWRRLTLSKSWYSKLLSHAIRLLRKRDSSNPKGWVQLLRGLSSIRIRGVSSQISPHTQTILAWHEILEVVKWLDTRDIEMGSDGFLTLCHSFSGAVAVGIKDPDSMETALKVLATAARRNAPYSDVGQQTFEEMVQVGLATLKRQFDRLVFLDPKTISLSDSLKLSLEKRTESQVAVPGLSDVPSPAVLHAFVRSLGWAEDSDGLLSLLRWMNEHASTLKQKSEEQLNGEMMMRRTIVAVRVFLEGYCGRQSESTAYESDFTEHTTLSEDAMPKAYESDLTEHTIPREDAISTSSESALQEAYDIITATEIWGSWPSDEEVSDYLAHGEQEMKH